MPTFRDRITELRRVPAGELHSNPKNWRQHPPSQRSALTGALEEIGIADAVIARETPTGLELIDGHLRQDVLGDSLVPVLLVDLTDEEADKLLLTLDPLASMATTNRETLQRLLDVTQFQDEAVRAMLESLNRDPDLLPWEADIADIESIPPLDSPILGKIVIECPVLMTGEIREAVEETLEDYPDARVV